MFNFVVEKNVPSVKKEVINVVLPMPSAAPGKRKAQFFCISTGDGEKNGFENVDKCSKRFEKDKNRFGKEQKRFEKIAASLKRTNKFAYPSPIKIYLLFKLCN